MPTQHKPRPAHQIRPARQRLAAAPQSETYDALSRRNQWLQVAVAGFAAWSVAATYVAVNYQSEDRADLEGEIARLKEGLFDFQSRSENLLEEAYARTEGSRSFAQISEMLALAPSHPITPATNNNLDDGPLAGDALLAHPHPETIDAEAAAQPRAALPQDDSLASVDYTPRLTMPAPSKPFGLPPQYGLLAESAAAPSNRFDQMELQSEQLAAAWRLPITPLAAKLAPVAVAALSLDGKSPTTVKVNGYRRARRSTPSALLAASSARSRRAAQAKMGNIHIKAYPGSTPSSSSYNQLKSGLGGRPSASPSAAPSVSTSGDVAKLLVP